MERLSSGPSPVGSREPATTWQQESADQLQELFLSQGWQRLTARDLDSKLVSMMASVEQETVECLLAWELLEVGGPDADEIRASLSLEPDSALDPDPDRIASTGAEPLLHTLNVLDRELAAMESWLDANAQIVTDMRDDMAEIENQNNTLEVRAKNYGKLEGVLKAMLDSIVLSDTTTQVLKRPRAVLLPNSKSAGHAQDEAAERRVGISSLDAASSVLLQALQVVRDVRAKGVHGMPAELRTLAAVREQHANLEVLCENYCREMLDCLSTVFQHVAQSSGDESGSFDETSSNSSIASEASDVLDEGRPSGRRRSSSGGTRRRSRVSSIVSPFTNVTPVPGTLVQAANPLQAAQKELHAALLDYDPLLENLSELKPLVMHDLLAHYAQITTDIIFYPHIKKFFARVFPCVAINKQRDLPLPSLAKAPTYPRPRRMSETGISPLSGRSTPAEVLHQCLSQLLPLVIKEQRFLVRFFRLRKEHSSKPDPSLTNTVIDQVVRQQWAKMQQKLLALVDEKDIAQSAELLCMLRVVARCVEDLDNFTTKHADRSPDDKVAAALALGDASQGSKEATSSPSRSKSSEGSPVDGMSGWLNSMLINLQVELTKRWQSFLHEQEAWIGSTIASAEMRQAGVLSPFSRFVRMIEILDDALTQDQAAQVEARTAAYHTLARALFIALEKAAKANEKYQNVVRLENYFYFFQAVTSRGIAGLETFVVRGEERYREQLGRYVEWHFRKEFQTLVDFFNRVESLAKARGVQEVQIHVGRTELQHVQDLHTAKMIKEGLKAVYKRLDKHLCKETNLLHRVWEEFVSYACMQWAAYSERAAQCYEATLEPSVSTIESLAKAVSSNESSSAAKSSSTGMAASI